MSKAYFARDALSNSGIKEILKSPAHFRHWTDNPKEDTSALRVGRALHARILEPHREDTIATFGETKTFNSKAGEAFLAMYGQSHICLTVDERALVWAMTESLHRQPEIMRLIDSCRREVEIYGQRLTEHGAIDTKVMLDAVNQSLILDLKTTDEPATDFEWTAKRYRYDIQAAWYRNRAYAEDGIWRDFYFVVVEKKPPYGVLMYHAEESMILRGEDACAMGCEIYGKAKALNRWDGYDTRVIRSLN